MPYWPSQTKEAHEGEGRSGGREPNPFSMSDLPSPLVPFGDFLSATSGSHLPGGGLGEEGEEAIEFEPTAFEHPVFIMFSSGTTGMPKCMVHGAGGKCVCLCACAYLCFFYILFSLFFGWS